jgi:hypothetical protein
LTAISLRPPGRASVTCDYSRNGWLSCAIKLSPHVRSRARLRGLGRLRGTVTTLDSDAQSYSKSQTSDMSTSPCRKPERRCLRKETHAQTCSDTKRVPLWSTDRGASNKGVSGLSMELAGSLSDWFGKKGRNSQPVKAKQRTRHRGGSGGQSRSDWLDKRWRKADGA